MRRRYPRGGMIRSSGPYSCRSNADGTILVTPAWPQFRPWTEEDGGGPGPISRLHLAEELVLLLNGLGAANG